MSTVIDIGKENKNWYNIVSFGEHSRFALNKREGGSCFYLKIKIKNMDDEPRDINADSEETEGTEVDSVDIADDADDVDFDEDE